MRLLRDVREGTRLLILLELTSRHHTRLKELADTLDMTVAGASEYVKGMESEGLVQRIVGELRATKKGVELLQERFRSLRTFVETSAREMAIIEQTVAWAGETLREGERVGLFMEKGTLVARRRASPSTGLAATAAKRGEVVWVRDLEGIVALRPGKISILRLARATKKADAARRLIRRTKPDVMAVFDARGKAFAENLSTTPAIEFAALPASIEAAQRGLRVLMLCPEERVAEVVAAIEDANARSEDKIPYETLAS